MNRWVIELPGKLPLYLDAMPFGHGWTTNLKCAERFASREDAQAYCDRASLESCRPYKAPMEKDVDA